jgi:hypothetical protein
MHEKVCGCVSGKWLRFVVAGFLEVINSLKCNLLRSWGGCISTSNTAKRNHPKMQLVAFRGWLCFAVQHFLLASYHLYHFVQKSIVMHLQQMSHPSHYSFSYINQNFMWDASVETVSDEFWFNQHKFP